MNNTLKEQILKMKEEDLFLITYYAKKYREIIKDGWDVFPPWLLALNIFAIVIGLAVIIFV